jgi:hypothetical protein
MRQMIKKIFFLENANRGLSINSKYTGVLIFGDETSISFKAN